MSNNSLHFSTQLSRPDYDLLNSVYLSVSRLSREIDDYNNDLSFVDESSLKPILSDFIELFISCHHNKNCFDLILLKRIITKLRLYASLCTVCKSLKYKKIGIDLLEYHNRLIVLFENLVESK
jgi:hypothetical protein